MTLSAGTRLGPYEIVAPIGAGGMGEVYRARDPRVGRDVAIKVSAERFSDRFELEARAIAALNHPNICQLYDVGPNYLVMELIEGEPLTGPLPVDQALQYAQQIADALEAAHEKGIVHRDLKPANIKVKPDGAIKVLDFGLAKSTDPSTGDTESSPTMTMSPTRAGMILGTAPYMSPEQARGKPVDKRTDIWAFGVVFYEILTGERLFQGETITDVLASVVKEQPDLDRLPEHIRPVLSACLQKDPKRRLQAIGDWRLLVGQASWDVRPTPEALRRLPWAVAAAFAIAFGVLSFLRFRETPPAAAVMRFEISAPGVQSPGIVRVSPDGRRIAYAARDSEGKVSLRVHSLESNSARSLPGTEGVTGSFFWSPDSRFLGFLVSNKLRKVEAAGSPPQTICDLPGPWRAGAWSPAGVIVFSISDKGLMRVSDGGGVPSLLLAEGHTTSPSFLSDGRHFLYQRSVDSPENTGIYLGSLDAKPVEFTSRRILATQSSPLYTPSSDSAMGYLLFTREGTLMAQLFDSRRMELAGEAVPIAEGFSNTGAFAASASATGVLAYRANPSPNSKLAWYDRSGKMLAASEPGPYNTLTLSPDGTRVAVAHYTEQEGNIWIHDSSLGPGTRFTFEKRPDWMPVWSPDGSRIVWSAGGDAYNLHQKASSGAGKEEVVLKSAERKFTNDWSRDGRFLLYSSSGSGSDLSYLPMTGDDRKPRIYLQTEFNEYQARFSPDTRFVAYTSDETGRPEVYVRPFPDAASGKWMVSKSGGNQPQWRGDGKELFYISGDSKMMSVEVSASPAFQSLAPKELFLAPIFAPLNPNTTRYSVTADGKRFVIVCTDGSQAPTSITVILNWQAGLRK